MTNRTINLFEKTIVEKVVDQLTLDTRQFNRMKETLELIEWRARGPGVVDFDREINMCGECWKSQELIDDFNQYTENVAWENCRGCLRYFCNQCAKDKMTNYMKCDYCCV